MRIRYVITMAASVTALAATLVYGHLTGPWLGLRYVT